jgi:hypothetical protein
VQRLRGTAPTLHRPAPPRGESPAAWAPVAVRPPCRPRRPTLHAYPIGPTLQDLPYRTYPTVTLRPRALRALRLPAAAGAPCARPGAPRKVWNPRASREPRLAARGRFLVFAIQKWAGGGGPRGRDGPRERENAQ